MKQPTKQKPGAWLTIMPPPWDNDLILMVGVKKAKPSGYLIQVCRKDMYKFIPGLAAALKKHGTVKVRITGVEIEKAY